VKDPHGANVERLPEDRPLPVSLIVPNRNNDPVLDLFFERLHENTTYANFELVVVDDGSTDGSLPILRRWRDSGRFRDFTLLEREHGGVVRALNAALEASSGALIVQLDADATLESRGWLEAMVDLQRSDPRVGTVASAVVLDNGGVQAYGMSIVTPEGAHGRGSRPVEPPGQRTWHDRCASLAEADATGLLEVAEVDCAMGCCMLYPRAMADELGGYDPEFSPVWFDDLDLSLGARRLGLKNFFQPAARVVHQLGMRNSRGQTTSLQLMRGRARRAGARVLPAGVKRAIWNAAGLDKMSDEKRARLEHHYAYWRSKWGFDFINPDMDAIRRRYGDTELWWAHDPDRRSEGEAIAANFTRRAATAP
jgi:GT2 family glycosyltransferase